MDNNVLLNSAKKIMANTTPAQFFITAEFINSQAGSTFKFYPFKINSLRINRDYLENHSDEIDLTIAISPKDYALLQDQGQDLLCILTITYVTTGGNVVYTPKPIKKQYRVIINDAQDIRKAIPDIELYTHPTTEITVRLVEETIYKLRHTKINTLFQNVTVTQAIYAITEQFGIERLYLVPPDNTHVYDHIDIPSLQGIGSIYLYLHSKCGLYAKGANSYITDGVLYIYPPFDTNPSYDKNISFYQVETGQFTGCAIFHKVENNNVSVVVNTQSQSYDLSITGAENVGTGFIFTRASRMTDGFTTIDNKTGAEFTDSPVLNISLTGARTGIKNVNNLFHIKATDNPYPAMSEIISHQASLMEVTWMHADPFQLDPGHSVNYYYDNNKQMVKKTGILQHAIYMITPMEKVGPKDMFGCVASLILRLSPNESKVF